MGLERANAHLQVTLSDLGSRFDAAVARLTRLENELALQGDGAAGEAEQEQAGQREPSLAGDGAAGASELVGLLTPRVNLAGSDTPPGTQPHQAVEDGLSNWWAQDGADNAVGDAARPDALVRQLLPGAADAAAVVTDLRLPPTIAGNEAERHHCDTMTAEFHLPPHMRAPTGQTQWQRGSRPGAGQRDPAANSQRTALALTAGAAGDATAVGDRVQVPTPSFGAARTPPAQAGGSTSSGVGGSGAATAAAEPVFPGIVPGPAGPTQFPRAPPGLSAQPSLDQEMGYQELGVLLKFLNSAGDLPAVNLSGQRGKVNAWPFGASR